MSNILDGRELSGRLYKTLVPGYNLWYPGITPSLKIILIWAEKIQLLYTQMKAKRCLCRY